MAFPIILIDSATGSDSLASGAGPSTALTGTLASTSGDGLTVTLDALTDLTGVSTTGSDVIYLADSTAGNRNFGKITGKAGSGGATPTVTVSNAFGGTLSTLSWAIGGKRASIGSTTSRKLLENNSAAGDTMPGWVVELQSGHSETIASNIAIRRNSDTTDGRIIFRGKSGASTLPLLNFSNDGYAITMGCSSLSWTFRDFELRNTNGSKTASYAFNDNDSVGTVYRALKIAHPSNFFFRGLRSLGAHTQVIDCEIGYTSQHGLLFDGAQAEEAGCYSNYIHDCGDRCIFVNIDILDIEIEGNIIANGGSDGIYMNSGTGGQARSGGSITQNVVYNCSGDGIEIASDGVQHAGMRIENNTVSSNGAYGINFSGMSLVKLLAYSVLVRGNTLYNNTSGAVNPSGIDESTNTSDPTFTNTSGGNFSQGTNVKAKGIPVGGVTPVGTYSSTYSYIDPGVQRQETGGGGGGSGGPMVFGF